MYLQRSPTAGQGCHGGVGNARIDVDERSGGREVEAVLVGGEAVDDGEDAAVSAADEEHGVLGVGEGAVLVLPLSAG